MAHKIDIHLAQGQSTGFKKLVEHLNRDEVVRRLFAKDKSLFKNHKPLMLGWLNAPSEQLKSLGSLQKMKNKALEQGFSSVVLLGMGGSSLSARVFKECLSKNPSLNFIVLDTIHPSALSRLEQHIDIKKTLFIVASKSGATLEPKLLYHHFHDRLLKLNVSCPAEHFMAISDPVTELEKLSVEQGFLQGPFGDEEIGGRYSALSAFGIMPALFMGIDVETLLQRAQTFADECAKQHDLNHNDAALLGVFLGFNATNNRSLLNFHFSEKLAPFGAWLEQLLAESLGKNDKGIVPIIDPRDPDPKPAISMHCLMGKRSDQKLKEKEEQLRKDGASFVFIAIEEALDLGIAMFMWEVATSIAGLIIDINPFDQPDVEKSKEMARDFMKQGAAAHKIDPDLRACVDDFMRSAKNCSFAAILSFLDECPKIQILLADLACRLQKKLSMPVLIQNGPRYLHSTGQLFKGGINEGCFLMLIGPYPVDFPSDIKGLGFKDIHLSQALGDKEAMILSKRRIVCARLFDIDKGFEELFKII